MCRVSHGEMAAVTASEGGEKHNSYKDAAIENPAHACPHAGFAGRVQTLADRRTTGYQSTKAV